ncbi:hypothetical protein D3C78_1483390 [compost metagenome]
MQLVGVLDAVLPGFPGLAAIGGAQDAVEQTDDEAVAGVEEVHRHQRLGAAVTEQVVLAVDEQLRVFHCAAALRVGVVVEDQLRGLLAICPTAMVRAPAEVTAVSGLISIFSLIAAGTRVGLSKPSP